MVRQRTAVFGGDVRQRARWADLDDAEFFMSTRYGGNGEVRRLTAALRGGRIRRVLLLTRWNGHSAVNAIRALCRDLGVPVDLVR